MSNEWFYICQWEYNRKKREQEEKEKQEKDEKSLNKK